MRSSARRARADRGSVSVEAVIVLPVFLLVVFAILQAGLWTHACAVAQAAAQDGARAGAAFGASPGQGQDTAEAVLSQRAAGEDWVVTITPGPDGLTVTVTGRAMSIVPGLVLDVRESASMPWEAK